LPVGPAGNPMTYSYQSKQYIVMAIGVGRARRTQFNWVVTGVAAAVNIVLNLLLIPPYGMMGAAVATVAAYMTMFVGMALTITAVIAWQFAEWALRLATVWFMLGAFRIEQSARNVLLVQAAESLATLVPISPGGVGTQQALLVYTLRGSASRSALLAFSVGMKLTLTCVNIIVGFTAILLTLRTLRFRRSSDPAAEDSSIVDT